MIERTRYQTKCKLRKGDEVVVLTGRERGKTGKLDRVDRKTGRVFVAGVNIAKRHTKPSAASEGGIIEKVMPLDISNVALWDPKLKKATRVGYKLVDGKRVRIAKASQTVLTGG